MPSVTPDRHRLETGATQLRVDDAWVLSRRGPRNAVDPTRPYAFFVEPERATSGAVEDVATIFLTNRECPFRCVFCDLWKNTTEHRVADGAVAEQIEWALGQLPAAPHVKLYNSGNFFDAQAIPRADWPRIAELVAHHRTVIVENHPKLVSRRCIDFARMIDGRLQVAMGLETVDPQVLPRLNKRMTLEDYEKAAHFLNQEGIDVRAFILLRAPWQDEPQGLHWAKRSIDFAFSIGVECCSILPTRAGNGAMEELQQLRHFESPALRSIEAALEYGLLLQRGRVFVDTWDLERFCGCRQCATSRSNRLKQMNLTQTVSAPVVCSCGT